MRDDISNKLIHFTKGDDSEAAETFLKIIDERCLRGGAGFIRGGYPCVCFTEAPIGKLAHILAHRDLYDFSYAPFGIMIDKLWLWQRGGRPVIYQPEEEYHLLKEEQKYRHKRYEPDNGIDFTWEREWRIKTTALSLDPDKTTLIVPNRSWANWLIEKHMDAARDHVLMMGENGHFYVEKYPWHIIALTDLGISDYSARISKRETENDAK